MPIYQFNRLPEGARNAEPAEMTLYDDTAAAKRAMGEAFPEGCDVWQGARYVGRFHRASLAAGGLSDATPDPEPDRTVRLSAAG